MIKKYIKDKKIKERDVCQYASRSLFKADSFTFESLNTYNSSIPLYYSYLSQFNDFATKPFSIDCFAIFLAELISHILTNGDYIAQPNGSMSSDFYRNCIEKAYQDDLAQQINDDDLMEIYIKQMVQILKTSGIIEVARDKKVKARECSSRMELFAKTFKSFWHSTDWSTLFPSNPHAAEDLKRHRLVIAEIILSHPVSISIENVANEFFSHTGFSRQNDLVMISFLDFYLFTWLKHFSIINYDNTDSYAPVMIKLTDGGGKILRLFS